MAAIYGVQHLSLRLLRRSRAMERAPSPVPFRVNVAALQRVATNDARDLSRRGTSLAKHIRVDIPRIPTLGIGGFFYSAIMYEAKRMLYAKRRLCVLWDFKERTLNALAFAGAQDIVSDTGCQCEQRRQHCREPDIEEDRLRPGAGEPGVRYLHKEDGA